MSRLGAEGRLEPIRIRFFVGLHVTLFVEKSLSGFNTRISSRVNPFSFQIQPICEVRLVKSIQDSQVKSLPPPLSLPAMFNPRPFIFTGRLFWNGYFLDF